MTRATIQPSMACGPPSADMRSGIVMNGPTPIMFVMLSAVAPSRPKRRGSRESLGVVIQRVRRGSGERIRDIRVARPGAELSTAGSDDDVLFSANREGARRCVAGRRERRFPEQLAARFVEGAELRVLRCGDEDEATSGDDWPTVLLGACLRAAVGR